MDSEMHNWIMKYINIVDFLYVAFVLSHMLGTLCDKVLLETLGVWL